MYVVFLTTHAQWHHMIHKTKSVIITEYRNRKNKIKKYCLQMLVVEQ